MALARSLLARLVAVLALGLLAAPQSNAATIGISPAFSSCGPGACGSLTVQLTLLVGEIDADSFGFDIEIDDAPLIGLSTGPIAGNPIAGLFGGVELLIDGTTSRGLLNSGASNFDGPGTFDLATIPLSADGNGTATFTFLSAEIVCESCGGGGTPYAVSNAPSGFLAQVNVVPEPGSFGLVALGVAALGASGPRHRKGGIR